MKKKVLILLSLAIYTFLPAQPQLRFQNFDTRDGLSHYHVNCLLKDNWGFIWIGTEFGLNRFDGVTFEKWFNIPGDTTSLVFNKINNIVEDHQQQLWIATDQGISVYQIKKGVFRSFVKIPAQNQDTIIPEQPNVFCDKDGDIWIGNSGGSIILYKTKTRQFFNIPILLSPPERMQNKYVGGFIQDSKERLWVATSYGIYKINKQDLSVKPYKIDESTTKNGPLLNTCTNLFETNRGHLICGTWNAGFIIFDELRDLFKPSYDADGPFLPSTVIFNFGQLNSTIFFATISGLFSCEENNLGTTESNEYAFYPTDPLDPFSIASPSISVVVYDTVGKLWVGGDRGLSLLNNDYNYYKSFSFNALSKNKNGYPVSIEQSGDQLFVALNNEVFVFDLQNESFLNTNPRLYGGGFHNLIKSDHFFLQLSSSGLFVYDENFNLIKTIKKEQHDGHEVSVFNAMIDQKGNLWTVTSRYGLRKHSPDGNTVPYLHDSTQTIHSVGDIIGDIVESKSGNLYAGGKQLFVLRNGSNEFESISILKEKSRNEIRALKIIEDILWIGSRHGLFSYNEQTGIVTHHKLPADINQVMEQLETDDVGNIWMITSSGLIKYKLSDSSTTVLNDKTGFPRSFSVIKKLEDGRIAVGSEGEIIIIDPALILPETYCPTPYFTEVVVDEDKTFLMPPHDTTYRLKYNQSIRFKYISLTYHNASGNNYEWQLQGLDNRWHKASSQTSQAFATLAPGRYSFSIRSANPNQVWSKSISTIHFIVMPPFYRTGWFVALTILSIGALIYWFYRYRLQKALQIERMRTRIATDLHDDIGATLSSISFYSEAVNQRTKSKLPEVSPILEKMGETSRSMVSSMSDIVWAINPQNDDMGKMLNRMKTYATELAAIKEKVLHISIDEKAHHLKPQLEHRRNIYLIFKEALTNAMKHADSSQVGITINLKGNLFQMQISDDGKGFNALEEGDGNGIKNMQRRAADIGATLKIMSEANKGTVINLELVF